MSAQPAPFNRQTARRFVACRERPAHLRGTPQGHRPAAPPPGVRTVGQWPERREQLRRPRLHDGDRASRHGGVRQTGLLYIGVFAAMTAVAVLYRFTEERLGLLWRRWLTRRVTERYLERRTYLRLKESAEIDNPDQRIAEDTRAFTTTTLSFTLIFLNSTLAVVSFSGVLWTISPLLFGVAVGYAALGTLHDGPAGPAARRVELRSIRPGGGLPGDPDPCPRERRIGCAAAPRRPAEGAAAEPDRRTGGELPADHVGEPQPGLLHDGLQLPDPDHTRP